MHFYGKWLYQFGNCFFYVKLLKNFFSKSKLKARNLFDLKIAMWERFFDNFCFILNICSGEVSVRQRSKSWVSGSVMRLTWRLTSLISKDLSVFISFWRFRSGNPMFRGLWSQEALNKKRKGFYFHYLSDCFLRDLKGRGVSDKIKSFSRSERNLFMRKNSFICLKPPNCKEVFFQVSLWLEGDCCRKACVFSCQEPTLTEIISDKRHNSFC